MTPTETNTLMRLAFSQFGFIEQTPELAGVWHQHLAHVDPKLAAAAVTEYLGEHTRPPTIANIKQYLPIVARRANNNHGRISPPAEGGPVPLGHQTCGAGTACEWLTELHLEHTEGSWDALTSHERVTLIRGHIRYHAGNTTGPKFRRANR